MSGIPERGYGTWRQWRRRALKENAETGHPCMVHVYLHTLVDDWDATTEYADFLGAKVGAAPGHHYEPADVIAQRTAQV